MTTCIYGPSSHEPKKPQHHDHHGHNHAHNHDHEKHHDHHDHDHHGHNHAHEKAHSHKNHNHKKAHKAHAHHHHGHHHGHSHAHDHHHFAGQNKKALLLSFIVTFAVMIAELVYGYLSNSLALISDALHMVMHAFALILSYFAVLATTKLQNAQKTYGYHRAEIIAAFVNAVLIALLTIFIIYEAIEKLIDPEPIDVATMLVVSGFGLFANIASALLLMRADLQNINVKSSFLHMLGDLFSSVAIIVGGVVVYYTNYYFIDTILALIIAFVIAKWSWGLFRQSLDILLETSPVLVEDVRSFVLGAHPIVLDIHDIHIVSIAQDYHVLTAHILIDRSSVDGFKSIVDELASSLEREFNITHITIQPEWHTRAC